MPWPPPSNTLRRLFVLWFREGQSKLKRCSIDWNIWSLRFSNSLIFSSMPAVALIVKLFWMRWINDFILPKLKNEPLLGFPAFSGFARKVSFFGFGFGVSRNEFAVEKTVSFASFLQKFVLPPNTFCMSSSQFSTLEISKSIFAFSFNGKSTEGNFSISSFLMRNLSNSLSKPGPTRVWRSSYFKLFKSFALICFVLFEIWTHSADTSFNRKLTINSALNVPLILSIAWNASNNQTEQTEKSRCRAMLRSNGSIALTISDARPRQLHALSVKIWQFENYSRNSVASLARFMHHIINRKTIWFKNIHLLLSSAIKILVSANLQCSSFAERSWKEFQLCWQSNG